MRKAPNVIDRTGQIFDYWTIVSYSHTDKHRKRHYLCRCRCGKEVVKNICSILLKTSFSCGCKNALNHIVHNKSNSLVYNIWQNMKNRCLSPKATNWKYYGGRGIKICDKWMDFKNFYEDMGDPPTKNHSIDRFPDNDGNYEPANCRWATKSQQAYNRRKPQPLKEV